MLKKGILQLVLINICMCLCTYSHGDSITYDNKTYSDVYIGEGSNLYYVQDPVTGSVTHVPKNSESSASLAISPDAKYRQSLLERWQAKQKPRTHPSSKPESQAQNFTQPPMDQYHNQAHQLVMAKGFANVTWKVVQSLEDGALAMFGMWDPYMRRWAFTGDIFWWTDSSNDLVADEEVYSGNVYWCGTYTYLSRARFDKTVNRYTTDYNKAIAMVRREFHLYDPSMSPSMPEPPPQSGLCVGTGFFVTNRGHVVTNNHVVKGTNSVKIKISSGDIKPARVIARDKTNDLALLAADIKSKAAILSRPQEVKTAQKVLAVGYPTPHLQGTEGPKVTGGMISGSDGNMYQTDAAIQKGNSGGPLLAATGEVVGVVRARMNELVYLNHTGTLPQNINWAVKVEHLLAFLNSQPEVRGVIKVGTVGASTEQEAYEANEDSIVFIMTVQEE